MASNNSINNQALNGFTASGGNISISADAAGSTCTFGNGAAAKLVTIGSTNSTSATTVQSGSGGINITATNASLTANSGTGALGISTDSSATTLSIGTGSAVKTITVGSTNSTSTTTLTSGSGGVQVGTFLNLPTTTSTVGQIKINSTPVFHTYGTTQTFVGTSSGNFTLTGSRNCAVGDSTLHALTNGQYNTIVGSQAGAAITSGSQNTALGLSALNLETNGGDNTAIGFGALNNCNGASSNTAVGLSALTGLGTGQWNVAIGKNAGSANTTSDSANIYILNNGNSGESNTIRIGYQTGTGTAQQNKAFMTGIYGITAVGTTSSIPVIDSNGQIATGAPASSTIGFSTDSNSATINIGTGAAVKTITVGSTNSTSTTTLTSGSGGVQVGTFLNLPTTTSTNGQIKINGSSVFNTYGTENIFAGSLAGNFSLSGQFLTGIGYNAMNAVTSGSYSAGVGTNALALETTGGRNAAFGNGALQHQVGGSYNVGVGNDAGYNYTSTESSNIVINAPGTASENNVLRIGAGTGTGNQQLNKAVICGINGISVTGSAVLVNGNDQLGITVSSARFKNNIEDMGDYSSNVLKLRPVTFNYTVGDDHSLQSGLIAEEVNVVMPSLVVFDKEGLPQTVKYQDLSTLLLNELQKALKRIDALEEKLRG